jgi:hypothetical protein
MKLFARSGGHWLFWSGFLYLSLTALVVYSPYRDYTVFVQLVWLIMVALPLICNPLARWLNMKENSMFDWMRKNKMPENVVPFPGSTKPHLPKELPESTPTPEKVSKTYYTFGLTDDNRVSFAMGYTTLTMNAAGVDQLITQLEFFKDQLHTEQE